LSFVAKTKTSNEWKLVTTAIQTLVEEATFDVTPEGINFRAMDPSHIALLDITWPSTSFEKYSSDEKFQFSVRTEDFVKLIRRANANDSIEIAKSDENTLIVKIQNGYSKEYKLHLVESSISSTPIPNLSLNSKINIKESAFENVLSDVSIIADHITIKSNSTTVEFYGKSDRGTASAKLEKNNDEITELEVKEESESTYSIEYMTNIVKAAGTRAESILMEYSSKMPIKFEIKLGDSEDGKLIFYLAPRIEDK